MSNDQSIPNNADESKDSNSPDSPVDPQLTDLPQAQPQNDKPYSQPQYEPYPGQQYAQPQYQQPYGGQQYGGHQYGAQSPYGQSYGQQQYQQPYGQPYYGEAKSRIAAGLLGIFLGALGIHNFYLGRTGVAIAQLLITVLSFGLLSWVSGIWGLIEGILILTRSVNFLTDANGVPLRD